MTTEHTTRRAIRRNPRRKPPATAAALQLEIAQKRGELAQDLDLLRDAVSVRLDPAAQLRAHPRIALGIAAVAVGAALMLGFAFWRAVRRA